MIWSLKEKIAVGRKAFARFVERIESTFYRSPLTAGLFIVFAAVGVVVVLILKLLLELGLELISVVSSLIRKLCRNSILIFKKVFLF